MIAEEIEAAVRAVTGVTDVFATAGPAARAAAVMRSHTPPLVTVEGRASVRRVTVSIGVAATASAPDVAAEVGAAVRALVDDSAEIVVRVGRVGG